MFFNKKNSKERFEQCLKPHLSYLYRIAMRLTGNNEDAQDLVQDLVLKIHSGKTDLFTLDNPKTWLSKVLYRLFIDNYRKNQRANIISIDSIDQDCEQAPLTEQANTSNPEQLLEQADFLASVEAALQTINEEQRMLIIMYEIEGFTLPEISEAMEIPVGTLKSRLHRARIKLRHYLKNTPYKRHQKTAVNQN